MIGERSDRIWPRKSQRFEPAIIHAAMFDLKEYPAIVTGSDRILGQLHHVAEADMATILNELDAFEGFVSGDPNSLYVRREVSVFTAEIAADNRSPQTAWVYLLNQPDLVAKLGSDFERIEPNCHFAGQRCVSWRGRNEQ